jgi:phosphatidylserine decarboxylase
MNIILLLVILAILLFILFFIRQPKRKIPVNPRFIVSPASGTVVSIREERIPELGGINGHRICIFLSFFDVHIQRSPYDGIISDVKHFQGRHISALKPQSVNTNESNTIIIETKLGQFLVRQIAGLFARRIICNVGIEDKVLKGEKLGMIVFGSRVEVCFSATLKINVKLNDKVTEGESVIALSE